MTRCLVWVIVASLIFVGVASASVKQGDTELDLLAGFTAQNGAKNSPDFSAWFASGALGYFLTDNLQVQAAVMAALTSTEMPASAGDVDVNLWALGGRAKWHFMPTNQLVPYVGAQLLWVNADVDGLDGAMSTVLGVTVTGNDGSSDGSLWGPLVGARYELNENNDAYVEYQYQVWEGDIAHVLDDGHSIFVGIIHQFK